MNFVRKTISKCKPVDICFGILLLISIVYMSTICYFDTISGDEYFSVGFANNTKGFLFLLHGVIVERFGSNGWIDGELLHDYLSVQPGDQCSILAIHRNIRGDVHPPLYFMLLNVLSSFFVDQVTIFPGFLINVVSGAIVCIILYLLGKKLFCNSWLALVAPIFWVASDGTRILITYLRMYAPLSALCLLCIYLHVLFLDAGKEKVSKWVYILLGVCTLIGTLTHYYFYIMLIVVGIISTVKLLYNKEVKKFFLYVLAHASGWIVSYMAYPYVFKHLLFSERGVQVQDTLQINDLNHYREFLGKYVNTIDTCVYDGRLSIIVGLIFLLVVVFIMVKVWNRQKGIEGKTNRIFSSKQSCIYFWMLGGCALGYLLIMFKISYSAGWNYLSPSFPLLAFFTVGILGWLIAQINDKYAYILILLCIGTMCYSMKFQTERAYDTYVKREAKHEAVTAYSDECDVLFFYEEWNNIFNNQMQELMEFDQIYSIDVSELEMTDYDTILNGRNTKQDIVIYIPIETEDYAQKAAFIAEKIGNGVPKLIAEEKFAIYYIEIE